MKIPDLTDHLSSLANKGMALGPLLSLLLLHLGSCVLDRKLYTKVALQMVKKLPLGERLSVLLLGYNSCNVFHALWLPTFCCSSQFACLSSLGIHLSFASKAIQM